HAFFSSHSSFQRFGFRNQKMSNPVEVAARRSAQRFDRFKSVLSELGPLGGIIEKPAHGKKQILLSAHQHSPAVLVETAVCFLKIENVRAVNHGPAESRRLDRILT